MSDQKDDSVGVDEQQAGSEREPTEAELEEMIEDAVDGGSWPVEKLKPVLEAVLFAAGDPLPLKRLAELVEGSTRLELMAALKQLQADYETHGIALVNVAGGWQLRTAPEHQSVIKKLFKERPFRLTRAALETLAIVAYRQPATRAEIEAVRGVDCSGVLESLVERKVIKVAGRRDVPGRPLVYATTQTFLEMFGLRDLKALPSLAELGDEFTNLADHTGFSESDERDAPVLPFEGDDGEGQEQTAGAQDDEAVERQGRSEESEDEGLRTEGRGQDDEHETDDEEADEAVDAQRTRDGQGGQTDAVSSGGRGYQAGDVPKIRFRDADEAAESDEAGDDDAPERFR